MKIAIVGTRGIPARYGGFETLVENLVRYNRSGEIEYTVFCCKRDYPERLRDYRGAELRYVPFFQANGIQSIPYDILSLCMSLGRYDVVLVLGVSGCVFLPVFRLLFSGKLIVNIDGLEHRRGKWSGLARKFLKLSESVAVRWADRIISDNAGIRDYVTETYGVESTVIAYGGDHVGADMSRESQLEILASYGLTPREYHLSICRIEPENNCHTILGVSGRSAERIVFIGNWNNSDYGRALKSRYADTPNCLLIDAEYDLDRLYALRRNCGYYIHGHSAGGTNPSLVEAMFLGCNIAAFDCVYNRETTANRASYFSDERGLSELLSSPCENGRDMSAIASERYLWKSIAEQYEKLY